MKRGFFDSISGNRSSTRLIGFIIIMVALVYAGLILFLGRNDIVNASVAAGTLFITIGGPAMTFIFWQKKNEVKHES